jgi:hypothetical protein
MIQSPTPWIILWPFAVMIMCVVLFVLAIHTYGLISKVGNLGIRALEIYIEKNQGINEEKERGMEQEKEQGKEQGEDQEKE